MIKIFTLLPLILAAPIFPATSASTASTAVIPLPVSSTATTQTVPTPPNLNAQLPPLYQAINDWAAESHRWECSKNVADVNSFKPRIEKVKKLLADGADPNQPHAEYPSALCYAATNRTGWRNSFNLPCVLMLLNAGAHPPTSQCNYCFAFIDLNTRRLLFESQHINSIEGPHGQIMCNVAVTKRQARDRLLAQKKALLKTTIITSLGSATNGGAFANLSEIICDYVGPLYQCWRFKSPSDPFNMGSLTTFIKNHGLIAGTKFYFAVSEKMSARRKILTLADQE